MLTRRTFIQSTGVLAAGATVGGIAFPKREFKEHGPVEIRFCLFDKDPIVIKSTIFSDERRDVFGIRVQGERGPSDVRLFELRLSATKAAVAVPGRVIQKCTATAWNEEGRKEEEFLDLVAKGGNLMFAGVGRIEKEPVWMSLADVQRVL